MGVALLSGSLPLVDPRLWQGHRSGSGNPRGCLSLHPCVPFRVTFQTTVQEVLRMMKMRVILQPPERDVGKHTGGETIEEFATSVCILVAVNRREVPLHYYNEVDLPIRLEKQFEEKRNDNLSFF